RAAFAVADEQVPARAGHGAAPGERRGPRPRRRAAVALLLGAGRLASLAAAVRRARRDGRAGTGCGDAGPAAHCLSTFLPHSWIPPLKDSMRTRLARLSGRLAEIDALLASEDAARDMNRFRALSRERAEIEPVVSRFEAYRRAE